MVPRTLNPLQLLSFHLILQFFGFSLADFLTDVVTSKSEASEIVCRTDCEALKLLLAAPYIYRKLIFMEQRHSLSLFFSVHLKFSTL